MNELILDHAPTGSAAVAEHVAAAAIRLPPDLAGKA